MSKRVIALLAGALAIALVAAGCGGGGGNESSTAAISKSEFIKKADGVCASGEKRLQAEAEKFAKEKNLKQQPSKAQFTEIAEDIAIPALERDVTEIRALGAPSGDEQKVDEILSNVEKGIEELKSDPAKFLETQGNPPAMKKANQLAKEYGLKKCGSG